MLECDNDSVTPGRGQENKCQTSLANNNEFQLHVIIHEDKINRYHKYYEVQTTVVKTIITHCQILQQLCKQYIHLMQGRPIEYHG